jgi:[ribosomal protein S18]-alanine N-acetyltransferase
MCVSSFNKDAARLYYKIGYEKVGDLKDFVIKGQSETLLRKTIGTLSEFKKSIHNP